jgi:CRISPR-associated endonuclease/helicase Cas3
LREACRFRSVAESFRMIDDDWSAAVVVPYDAEAVVLLNQLRRLTAVTPDPDAAKGIKGRMRGIYRKLQQYTVTAPRRLVESPAARGAFVPELAGVVNAIDPAFHNRLYSERYGLEFKDELSLIYDPDHLVG